MANKSQAPAVATVMVETGMCQHQGERERDGWIHMGGLPEREREREMDGWMDTYGRVTRERERERWMNG
jgi:hypothetical protein